MWSTTFGGTRTHSVWFSRFLGEPIRQLSPCWHGRPRGRTISRLITLQEVHGEVDAAIAVWTKNCAYGRRYARFVATNALQPVTAGGCSFVCR